MVGPIAVRMSSLSLSLAPERSLAGGRSRSHRYRCPRYFLRWQGPTSSGTHVPHDPCRANALCGDHRHRHLLLRRHQYYRLAVAIAAIVIFGFPVAITGGSLALGNHCWQALRMGQGSMKHRAGRAGRWSWAPRCSRRPKSSQTCLPAIQWWSFTVPVRGPDFVFFAAGVNIIMRVVSWACFPIQWLSVSTLAYPLVNSSASQVGCASRIRRQNSPGTESVDQGCYPCIFGGLRDGFTVSLLIAQLSFSPTDPHGSPRSCRSILGSFLAVILGAIANRAASPSVYATASRTHQRFNFFDDDEQRHLRIHSRRCRF